MRTLTVVALLSALALPATRQPIATAADLGFMTGCWRFEAKGRVVEEHWTAPAGGTLMGLSRTIVNGKTSEFEFLQIRDLAEGLAYIAKPSNQPEATFVATSKTADEIVFENPKHDFPQRIRYRLAGDALQARVEGTVNGKARGFDIPYTRTNCVP
jgi:hypothetical protein